MSHYVCQGDCKTVSDNPGVCQSDFCNKSGEDLAICGCGGNEHNETTPGASSEETTEDSTI